MKELEELKDKVADLEAQVEDLEIEIDGLNNELRCAQDEISDLESQIEDNDELMLRIEEYDRYDWLFDVFDENVNESKFNPRLNLADRYKLVDFLKSACYE